MNNYKKILLTMFVMIASVFGLNFVNAATPTKIQDNASSPQNLTITREVTNTTNSINSTFTYTIVKDEGPGNVTNLPTNVTVVFNNVAPVNKVATQTGTLDMSGVTFDKVGDYRLKITETSVTDAHIPLDPVEYYVLVSVRNTNAANPDGTLVATLLSQAGTGEMDNTQNPPVELKSDLYFESELDSTYIKIKKNVTGELADTDKWFEFQLSFDTIAKNGDRFTINGEYSTNGTDAGRATSGTYTVGTTTSIWLKHGGEVTIGLGHHGDEIIVGTKYTVTENGASDYKTYINGSTTNNKAAGQKTTVAPPDNAAPTAVDPENPTPEETAAINAYNDAKTAFDNNNVLNYVNDKENTTLTGIFMNIYPFVILLGLSVLGVILIKRTSDEEEAE